MNHTPAPWAYVPVNEDDKNNPQRFGIVRDGDPVFGKKHFSDIACIWLRGNKKRTEANAKLIAAAPDLLEALQSMIDDGDKVFHPDDQDCPYKKAAKAIAKATA